MSAGRRGRPAEVLLDLLAAPVAALRRRLVALTRPSGRRNARRLRARGETLDTIVVRDAAPTDVPALAELHVTLWNATYRTAGPSVATRARQWTEVLGQPARRDFVVVLEDRRGALIGFAAGRPGAGPSDGELAKLYLRWDYHGLGLGRRLMHECARRFLDRGIRSVMLFADPGNPTIGFYDRLGGERLRDERGRFAGSYAWRDVRRLLDGADGARSARPD